MPRFTYSFMFGFLIWMFLVWLAGVDMPSERSAWALGYVLAGVYLGANVALVVEAISEGW